MTLKEKEQLIKEMKEYTKKLASNKKEARSFLKRAGISTQSGRLTKHYK